MRRPGIPRLPSLPRQARAVSDEVREELAMHFELSVEHLVASGLSPEAARAEALRRLAHAPSLDDVHQQLARAAQHREERMRLHELVDVLRADITSALRALRARPAFAFIVVAILALGIGANATMFGVIDRMLLRAPAHVVEPESVLLASLVRTRQGVENDQDYLSWPIYLDLRDGVRGAFAEVGAFVPTELAVGRGLEAERVVAARVTSGYFRALGVRPERGRFFLAEEDGNPTGAEVAVIGHAYWQRRFGGAREAVGSTLQVGDLRYTIVGVAPEHFAGTGQRPIDLFVPITAGVTAQQYAAWERSRDAYWIRVVTRLATAVTPERAMAEATAANRAGSLRDGITAQSLDERRQHMRLTTVLPRAQRAGTADARVAVMLGAVSLLVLLIACANVANLLLARGLARGREIAVRLALGVGRGRLLRQLVLESVLLALAGGVAALVLARWGGRLLGALLTAGAPPRVDALDPRLLAYTLMATLVTGTLAGLFSALQVSRPELAHALRSGNRDGGGRRRRARSALLVLQAALSVILLVGTGLFVRSLRRVEAMPLGFDQDRVLVGWIQGAGSRSTSDEEFARYVRLRELAREQLGSENASLATSVPFATTWSETVTVPGRDSLPLPPDGGPYFNAVSGGFFTTMGMRVLRGRGLTEADDRAGAARVVVVNETLARMWWPNEDAIGHCMKIGGDTMPCAEVVGVVANARRQALLEDVSVQFFIPLAQRPPWLDTYALFMRVGGEPEAAIARLRPLLQGAVPDLPYVDVRSLESYVAPQARSWRLGATAFGAFGALALVLVVLGIFSVLSYDVAQRRHEFGVRMALGAERAHVARMIVGEGMRTALLGAAIGLVASMAAGGVVAPLLFETSPREPLILAGVAVVMALGALIGTLAPSLRALRVDPAVALRGE